MSVCEVTLSVLAVVIALLTLALGYWISLAKKLEVSKTLVKEPKIKFTGVPAVVFKDEKVAISAQDGVKEDTLVVVIRVIVRDTNKVYTYVHSKEEDCYVRIPEVEAVMVISGTTVKEVVYPLEMTS